MDNQVKNLLEGIDVLNIYISKLERYTKYLQSYIENIGSEDLDSEDYLSFEQWLKTN